MLAMREGETESVDFEQQLHSVVRPSLLQLFTMRSRLLQLKWCTADIPSELFADCISSIASLKHLDAKGNKPDAMDVPRSVCLRLMRAAILKELAIRGDTGALRVLSFIPSPFDSWTSSAPANEDDWLDPAEELIDTESMFAWEEQVSCNAGIGVVFNSCIACLDLLLLLLLMMKMALMVEMVMMMLAMALLLYY